MTWTDNTMAKRKRTNNDLQNTTQKTKDRATRTSLKTGLDTGAQEGKTEMRKYGIFQISDMV